MVKGYAACNLTCRPLSALPEHHCQKRFIGCTGRQNFAAEHLACFCIPSLYRIRFTGYYLAFIGGKLIRAHRQNGFNTQLEENIQDRIAAAIGRFYAYLYIFSVHVALKKVAETITALLLKLFSFNFYFVH